MDSQIFTDIASTTAQLFNVFAPQLYIPIGLMLVLFGGGVILSAFLGGVNRVVK